MKNAVKKPVNKLRTDEGRKRKMRVTIKPGKAKGCVKAPPSKSMAHRLLIGAGLADGMSRVSPVDLSEDIKATLGMLKALGASYEAKGQEILVKGADHKSGNAGDDTGNGQTNPGSLRTRTQLDSGESGSTLRFFIPIVLAMGGTFEFTGAKRLFERPLGVYEEICAGQGIGFTKSEQGLCLEGRLSPGAYRIPGNISSQFVTGLLYALPLLPGDSTLEVISPIESGPYIDMTMEALSWNCICIKRERTGDGMVFHIPGRQAYRPADVTVEGDYSNAAFPDAFNLLGGNVTVTGLSAGSLQGDRIYRTYYDMLRDGTPTLDIKECPDLGPILMGLAAALNGARFTGTARLRIKESDRGAAMAEELKKFGVNAQVMENEILIMPGKLKAPEEELNSHGDHRIAMTLSILCTITGGVICGAEAVRKSYPGFFLMLKNLGIQVEEST